MTKDALFIMAFDNEQGAHEMQKLIGIIPERSYFNQKRKYIIQYGLVDIMSYKIKNKIKNFVKSSKVSNPDIIVDIPILFPERLASKKIRVNHKIVYFILEVQARLEYSVYKT
jgi:hypothetical protein